jgi:5S rRNA maturation endonuclease (ribonuclease M5)
MVTKEGFHEFLKALARLKQRVESDRTTILVEGERDAVSLASLGIARDAILVLNRGQTLVTVVETLAAAHRPVVLLMDWDRKGAELSGRLSALLHGTGIRVDLDTRRRFSKAIKGEVTEVEDLYGWAERSSKQLEEPMDIDLFPTT